MRMGTAQSSTPRWPSLWTLACVRYIYGVLAYHVYIGVFICTCMVRRLSIFHTVWCQIQYKSQVGILERQSIEAARRPAATGRERSVMQSTTLLLAALLALMLPTGNAKTGPKATSVTPAPEGTGTGSNTKTKSTGTAGHHGPYEVRQLAYANVPPQKGVSPIPVAGPVASYPMFHVQATRAPRGTAQVLKAPSPRMRAVACRKWVRASRTRQSGLVFSTF